MTELVANNLTVKAKEASLVHGASFSLRPGELVALLGPNGAGKTSLIRAGLGLTALHAGRVLLDGRDIRETSAMERARLVSYLPQIRPLAWPSSVRDVVSLGRFSYGAGLGRLSRADNQAVAEALEQCALEGLADRATDTLSGGELARVHCARAFAAKAPLLIADEPVAALDPRHQFRIMDLMRRFVASGGGALIVLHDLQLAMSYASRIILMNEGQVVADGAPTATLTSECLRDVYGVHATIEGGRIVIDGAT
jgi:iron complex transport system ATP-binding protein